jgi:hypothetical protein
VGAQGRPDVRGGTWEAPGRGQGSLDVRPAVRDEAGLGAHGRAAGNARAGAAVEGRPRRVTQMCGWDLGEIAGGGCGRAG